MQVIIFGQLIVTALLTGLIWMVQLVHYPSFTFIAKDKFDDFHQHHSKSISIIVMPLMILEISIAAYLLRYWTPSFYVQLFLLLNLGSVFLIWMSTFLLSVPLHSKLGQKADEATVRSLVKTNWPRTILWSLRLIFLIYTLTHSY